MAGWAEVVDGVVCCRAVDCVGGGEAFAAGFAADRDEDFDGLDALGLVGLDV